MGANESSHGSRKVSFGLDERDQVRVLQGIRLTDDVVNRMKESAQGKRNNQRSLRSSNGTATEGKPKSPTGTAISSQLEQALVQEELLRLAKREREAASEAWSSALQQEKSSTDEERQRVAQLVSNKNSAIELQGREAELKRQEAFYKEQLARIERK
ncbi:MIC25 protein, partial [Turnix velox]|nr:MIC25 protein [Turnix velox]